MIIGILADAHGNTDALQRAVDALSTRVDAFLFAGDAFSDHRFSNECVDVLRRIDAQAVLGNHELGLLSPAGTRAREAAHVRDRNLDWVRGLPTQTELRMGGRHVRMFHSTPHAPYDRYVTPDARGFVDFATTGCDLVVVGHAHVPFAAAAGSVLVVNPGAVGRADDPSNLDAYTCAVVDLATLDVEHIRFSMQ